MNCLLLPFVGAVCLAGAFAADVTPVPLRYQFTPRQTNAYSFTLEAMSQDRPVTLAGVVYVTVRTVEDGTAALGFRGNVAPRGARGGFVAMGYRAGGSGEWAPRPLFLQPNLEIRVDDRGRVVRDTGFNTDLPAPFGSLPSVFFEPVPAEAQSEWESEANVAIEDETPPIRSGTGPEFYGGYYPGRSMARLAASQTVRWRLTGMTDATVTFTKKVELASLLMTGNTPRFQVSGEGEVLFDRKLGLVRAIEFRALSVVTTATLTQRRPMTLKARLLEGEELEKELKALAPPEGERPPVITANELTKLVGDLAATDEAGRLPAINRLQTAEIETPTPELLAAAVKLANASDFSGSGLC